MNTNETPYEVSVVMPCLDEAETLEICIKKAQSAFKKENIIGEVIISDNGSTDGSIEIATRNGATVVHTEIKGYGAALRNGIIHAQGKFIIMGDADDSYDFSNLTLFIEKLREGYDLVLGNRFKGGIEKGAMPFLHKYLGNPVLSFIGRLFFKSKLKDFHCGLRGFKKEAFNRMELQTTGMEFASEMIVISTLKGMKITEVPTTLAVDGRTRPPHLRTFRDGWRHLRFLLMFAPQWTFLIPGFFLLIISVIGSTVLFYSPFKVGDVIFDVNTLIVFSFTFLIGVQFVFSHLFVKTFRITSGLLPGSNRFNKFYNVYTLEKGIVLGAVILIVGICLLTNNFLFWKTTGYSALQPTIFVRRILFSVVPIFLGVQTIFNSFLLGILTISRTKTN
jgi:glycosyltransferase involved in cell wall biosynthesis